MQIRWRQLVYCKTKVDFYTDFGVHVFIHLLDEITLNWNWIFKYYKLKQHFLFIEMWMEVFK